MVKELREQETDFGIELATSVENRIHQRRQVKHATLLAYLENPIFLHASVQFDKVLPYSSKTAITALMKDLYIRLFGEEKQSEEPANEAVTPNAGEDADLTPQPPKRNKSQELREFKELEVMRAPDPSPESFTSSSSSSSRVLAAIRNEMKTWKEEAWNAG